MPLTNVVRYNIIKLMKRLKKRRKIKKRIVIFLIIILFILVLGYVFLFSPLFKVKAVEVSGNKEVRTEEIKENFNYRNVFLYTEKQIKSDVLSKFPKVLEVEVKKNLIKLKIELIIKERKRFAIICRMGLGEEIEGAEATDDREVREKVKGCFYIGEKGFVFEEALETSGSLILLIKDYSQKDFNVGEQLFREEILNFISQIKENLYSETGIEGMDFVISSFPYNNLKVITSEGWYIVFNLQRDAGGQILALRAALEEGIDKEKRAELEYIDLRIENRVYYK